MSTQPVLRAHVVDRIDVRRHNLSVVLRLLADHGPRSRAGIAAATGLTKATVSSLVGDLEHRGLVADIGPEADQRLGRPATLVSLDGAGVVTLGVEVNVGSVAVLGTDLAGRTVHDRRRPLDTDAGEIDTVVRTVVAEIERAITTLGRRNAAVVGVTLAIPGVVDAVRGRVVFAPNLKWRSIALGEMVRAGLGTAATHLGIDVLNEANLGALAEHRLGGYGPARNLVYLLAADGVGAGVIVDGALLRGAGGAAGEIGHTTVQVRGRTCSCGSRGCWETFIAVRGLLHETMPDQAEAVLADTRTSAEAKAAMVTARAQAADRTVIDGLRRYGRWLGIGLGNTINAFNPDVLVLGGFLPAVAPWVLPEALETVARHALVDSARVCRIELTKLGFSPSARGGAIHAAERVFANPLLIT